MDSRWPLHSSENKHLAQQTRDFDLNIAANEPVLDMSLGSNAFANAPHPQSNSPHPILPTRKHYQNVDASCSQATDNFPSSSCLIPGYYDCLNQCFIPSATAVSPPVNSYSVFGNPPRGRQLELGSLGQDYYEWQVMQVNNASTPVRQCANCHTTDTPMWRRGPGGPKSLCNACGIKDRKERERKRAEESVSQKRS